jgi:hypothetical protein
VDLLETIAVGSIASLLASFLFLFFMLHLRPKIEVSPFIAKEKQNGRLIYGFKIVNRGSRPIMNLRAELVLVKSTNVEGGPMYWLQPIPLNKDEIFFVSEYSRRDQNADYAIRLSTNEDIDALWASDSDRLELNIYATDSLSGFGGGA